MQVTSIRPRVRISNSWRQDTIKKAVHEHGWQLGKEVDGVPSLIVPKGLEPLHCETFFAHSCGILYYNGGTVSKATFPNNNNGDFLLTIEHILGRDMIPSRVSDSPIILPIGSRINKKAEYIRLSLTTESVEDKEKLTCVPAFRRSLLQEKNLKNIELILQSQGALLEWETPYSSCTKFKPGHSGTPLLTSDKKIIAIAAFNLTSKGWRYFIDPQKNYYLIKPIYVKEKTIYPVDLTK